MKFSELTAMSPHVAGYLDWFSGLMFINETADTWRFYERMSLKGFQQRAGKDRRFDNLAQTLVHESFHFFQITLTGYLYIFVCRLYEELSSIIGQITNERLREVVAEPPQMTPRLQSLFSDINQRRADLSVRAIVESAAYLYEKRFWHNNLTPDAFEQILAQERPPVEYRQAYELLRNRHGATAFYNLLPLCLVALLFESPADALPALASAAAASDLIYRSGDDIRSFLNLATAIAGQHTLIGTAIESLSRHDDEFVNHPIYLPAVVRLNALAAHKNPLLLLLEPTGMAELDIFSILGPMRLRDGHITVPPIYERALGRELEIVLEYLSAMASAAACVLSYRETRVRS